MIAQATRRQFQMQEISDYALNVVLWKRLYTSMSGHYQNAKNDVFHVASKDERRKEEKTHQARSDYKGFAFCFFVERKVSP